MANKDRLNKTSNERRAKKKWEGRERVKPQTKEEKKAIRLAYFEKNKEKIRLQKRVAQQLRNTRKKELGGNFDVIDIKRLFSLQQGKCVACRCDISGGYHVDHIIPVSLGGHSNPENLQLLCPFCNVSKSNRHPVDFMQSRGFLL